MNKFNIANKVGIFVVTFGLMIVSNFCYAQNDAASLQQDRDAFIKAHSLGAPNVPLPKPVLPKASGKASTEATVSPGTEIMPTATAESNAAAGGVTTESGNGNAALTETEEGVITSKPPKSIWDKLRRAPEQKTPQEIQQQQQQQAQRYNIFQ